MSQFESWDEQVRNARSAKASSIDGDPEPPPIPVATSLVPKKKNAPLADPRSDWELTLLTAWLWVVFALANVFMIILVILFVVVASQGKPGGFAPGTAVWIPVGYLVVTGGFLGVIRAIAIGSESIAAAIRSTPDATATALRRAAKTKGED